MNLAEYKHIPLHDKFEMERNESWLLVLDIWDMEIVIFRLSKESSPPLFYPALLYHQLSHHVLRFILSHSYPDLHLSFFGGPVLDLLCSYTASANRSVRGGDCFLQLGQIWHYWILSASTLFPQVPTKKAKLKESLLQIMDDEEDPLDKYLVRNLSLPPNHLWTASL